MSLDPLFAQAGLTDAVFWALRAAAGLGGALVGWFVSDPLTRLLYRAAFAKPPPGWVLPWAKLAGAILVGLLVFFFIPLGGGPGGFGFGPGQGGGAIPLASPAADPCRRRGGAFLRPRLPHPLAGRSL